jgi:hypothetical protein
MFLYHDDITADPVYCTTSDGVGVRARRAWDDSEEQRTEGPNIQILLCVGGPWDERTKEELIFSVYVLPVFFSF